MRSIILAFPKVAVNPRSETLRAVGLAAASAVLLFAASPTVGIAAVGWVALIPAAIGALSFAGRAGRLVLPLTLALYMETQLVPALPFGLTDGQWGEAALPVLVGGSPVVVVALVAVPLYGLLLYLLPLRAPPALASRSLTAAVAIPALALTAVEFARANVDPAGLWGSLALTQAASAGAAPASIAGPWLLTFLIVAVSFAVAAAITRRSPRPLLAVALALPLTFLAAGIATPERGQEVRLAAIQPGYDTAEEEPSPLRRWEPGSYRLAAVDVIGDLAGPTERAAAAGAEIVVWPEATTFVDPHDHALVRGLAERLAEENGVAIVFPHFDYERSDSAVSLVSAAGAIGEPQPKQRPMWFLGESAAGAPARAIDAGGVELGVLLGVDPQDPDVAASLVDDGAGVLVSATHDWRQMASQQRAQARLIARATGTPLVRADWRYGSAVIGGDGDLAADAGEGKRRAVITGSVATGGGSAYAEIGGLFGWLCLAALAGLLAGALINHVASPSSRSREPRRASPHPRPSPAPPRAGRARSGRPR